MIKAIISKGVIVPHDPLPDDWPEGTEVAVERFDPVVDATIPTHNTCAADEWMDEVEAIAREGDPQDDERLDAAIQQIQRREKHMTRKRLGLE